MPAFWLVKSDPDEFGWPELARVKKEPWDGVRNYQARNNLNAMKQGDRVLVYHSGKERQVVGVAVVETSAYPDPTIDDERWVAVDLRADYPLRHPVTLDAIKRDSELSEIALVRQSRLSVMPVSGSQFERILKLGGV